jgi:hypothetical protein
MRFTTGTAVLVLETVSVIIVAWLAINAQVVSYTSTNFQVICWALTIYTSIQTILAVVLLVIDVNESLNQYPDITQWIHEHTALIDDVFLRHLLHSTGTLGATALAMLPFALQGGLNGDLILLILLLPIFFPLVYYHTYYLLPYTAMQIKRPGPNGWHITAMVIQIILWIGLVGTLFYFFLAPFVDTASPFFSQPANFVAGMFFFLSAVALPCFVIAIEQSAISKKEAMYLQQMAEKET